MIFNIMKSWALIYYYRIKICLYQFLFYFPKYIEKANSRIINNEWFERIKDIIDCPEFKKIEKSKDAGKIINGKIIMFNNVKIFPISYYRYNYFSLLMQTNGIHEPQEELLFSKICEILPESSLMIELGSYWAFYSLSFYKSIKNAKNFMIEPELSSLEMGKYNFRINNAKGTFYNAFIDEKSSFKNNKRTICIDDFVKQFKISHITILHSDIQGFEYAMLKGAETAFDEKIIDFVFISTHSNELHNDCLKFLQKKSYTICLSINLNETFSIDGLIFAHNSYIKIPEEVTALINSISKKPNIQLV